MGAIALMVILPTAGHYAFQWRKAELDATLKRDMIARDMSVDEIERVLAAKSPSPKSLPGPAVDGGRNG